MAGQSLFDLLIKAAEAAGYVRVVEDVSSGEDSLPPSLVILRDDSGAVYAVHVDRVS